ncbi:MAG: hypothetical protein K5767_05465 [Clostridia bacterium]|nr:hypothetical protein [Clostridia bacterium]
MANSAMLRNYYYGNFSGLFTYFTGYFWRTYNFGKQSGRGLNLDDSTGQGIY